ncbi:hypothetical protein RSA46_22625, partial [Pseudomonas oryzihabitans]
MPFSTKHHRCVGIFVQSLGPLSLKQGLQRRQILLLLGEAGELMVHPAARSTSRSNSSKGFCSI